MYNQSNNLAIIPARAGSKGIINKNLMQVGSKNLIEHAINASASSKRLQHTIVTSDHPSILEIGENLNVYVRNRPAYMATDESPVVLCLQDAVMHMETTRGTEYTNIILLQPTSPIRTGKDIDNIINMLDADSTIEGIVSVAECGVFLPDHQYVIKESTAHPSSLLIPYNNYDSPLSNQRARRQDIQHSYVRNGAIYAARRNILMDDGKIIVDNKVPYIMPKKYICNLDDYDDLALAKIIVPAWENDLL